MGHFDVKGKADLQSRLATGKTEGKLVVIDWFAPWCGPCQRIAPFYNGLAARYPGSIFLTVNSEDISNKMPENLLMTYGVRSFPTFTFHIDGNEVDRMVGANPQKLEETIGRWEQQIEDKQLADALKMSATNIEDDSTDLPSLSGVTTITVNIKKITGDSSPVEVEEDAKIALLKRRIQNKLGHDPAAQRLIFQGRILQDDQTLKSIGITDQMTLHISVKQITTKPSPASTSESMSASYKRDSNEETEERKVLRNALSSLVTANGKEKAQSAIFVMQLYVRNIERHPDNIKYRKIRVGNAKFASTVKACRGGDVCMKALGFSLENQGGEDYWIMQAAPNISPLSAELESTLSKLRTSQMGGSSSSGASGSNTSSGTSVPSSTPASPPNPFLGMGSFPGMGMGGMGGSMGGMGGSMGGFPGMPNMDPAAIQQMLANPAIQNMMQSPAMQNAMESMRQRVLSGQNPMDPEAMREMMMQTMSDPSMLQMMSDPNVMRSLAGARANMGMNGGANMNMMDPFGLQNGLNNMGISSNGTASSSTSNTNADSNNNNTNDDDDDDDSDLDDIYST